MLFCKMMKNKEGVCFGLICVAKNKKKLTFVHGVLSKKVA